MEAKVKLDFNKLTVPDARRANKKERAEKNAATLLRVVADPVSSGSGRSGSQTRKSTHLRKETEP